MTDLTFTCVGSRPDPSATMPTLLLDLHVEESTGTRVHALLLQVQIRIQPAQRGYAGGDGERLSDLFGDPSRWGETLKPIQLASVARAVPGFTGATDVALSVPCTYDLEIAASRYLHGLRDGEVPLLLLFSGTVFGMGDRGLQVEQVPWDREASYRLPVAVWREMMDLYFPGQAWLRLRIETVDALARVKSREALLTWEDTVERLLKQAGETP
ncbi:MAG: DUF6084 family protein [Actinomycetes bacterium]